MARGTITNKETGQTLTGEITRSGGGSFTGKDWFDFRVDGTRTEPTFLYEDWYFTPERKFLAEQIEELPTGTPFYLSTSFVKYIRLGDDKVVRLSPSEGPDIRTAYSASQYSVAEDVTVIDWSEFND